jgi:hypothetical protein
VPVRRSTHRGRNWSLGILGALVLVAVAVLATLLVTGQLNKKVFDQASVQQGVTQVLVKNYGIASMTNASCPSGIKVKTGTTFDCTVQIGTSTEQVTVTVLNSRGQYEVGAPR